MEARSRSLGFGFPGYDGCFPKATRSSRGRGDHTMRKSLEASDLPKDMCFFELLATVAGQLLQEHDGEALTARSLIDLEAPKMNAAGVLASGIRSRHTEESETAIQTKKEDNIGASKNLRNKSDKCYQPSATNFSLHDTLDTIHGQKQDMKPLEEPIKAYSSRKRKTSGARSSATLSLINRHVKTEPCAPRADQCTSKANGDLCEEVVNAPSKDLKETISWNKQQAVVDQLGNAQCQEIGVLAPFQHIESPLLVSSGSSEETSFPLEPKSYSTVAYELNRQGEAREEISSWKVGDDDDNSSESIVPKSLITKSSSLSYTRAMKARRCTNSTARKRGLGSKRKCHEIEDGQRSQNEKARSGKKKASKLSLSKADIEQSNNWPRDMPIDAEPDYKFDGSPLNSEREKSSSIMSSPITSIPAKCDDTNVELSIKSFMVPELMVALPESATVANLKKAVMDAAMNLLGGGLCVRVLLQGKKVTDETESLLQAGISGGEKSDSLGFMLEPNSFPAPAGVDDAYLVLSHNDNQTSSRYPVLSKSSEINTGSYHVGGASEGLLEVDANSSGTEMQSTTVSRSQEDGLVHDSSGLVIPGSCALVRHSCQANTSPNGLAVVPFGQNSGSLGINKRRIRRPFTVAEVEVLLQAVEKLGTGRWRDVKLHAFPQAKHRTYVDLKDKWKTLVHTASIAPHQRRGEPVPQGLLDRVIQAHSYWTAQQAKQQSLETKVF